MSIIKTQDDTDRSFKKQSFQVDFEHPQENVLSERFNTSFHYLRYVVVILGGFIVGTMLICRLSINVALISMVNKTAIYLSEHPNSTAEDFFPPDYVETGIFEWNHEIQQLIMTGYMVSYALPQYATTRLSLKYGLNYSVPISLTLCAISCLLIPIFSYWGWEWTLALRLINGVGASAIYPVMFSAIELWMPPSERAKGLALLQFTQSVINCFIPWVSGLLTSIHWEWALYVPFAIGIVVSVIWFILVADRPAVSKLISQKELDLIQGDTKQIDSSGTDGKAQNSKEQTVPWYFVFKIKSFYFLSIGLFLLDATQSSFLYILPSYINRVLKSSIEEIGLIYSIVQIGTIFCLLCPNPIASFLQRQFQLSLTAARKIMTFVCCLVVCSSFTYLAFCHDNLIFVLTVNRFFHVAIDFIILTTIMSQFSSQGLSGLVFAVVNALANLGVLIACWMVGKVLDATGDSLESWSWILNTFSGMMVVYCCIYISLLRSEPNTVKLPPAKSVN